MRADSFKTRQATAYKLVLREREGKTEEEEEIKTCSKERSERELTLYVLVVEGWAVAVAAKYVLSKGKMRREL